MLNPIDTDAVIRDGRVTGVFPGEIHEGVAWWVASCFIVTSRTHALALAHDGHPTTAEFHQRFCRGAVNAEHWACQISDLGNADETQLLRAMKELGGVLGARLSTAEEDGHKTVTLVLYDAQGQPVTDDTGLARIRKMIADGHVPIPVNDRARGSVVDRRDLVGAS